MSNESQIKDVNALIEKYDSMKKQEKMDLSSDQDLTIAIMNLISIEEHLAFSGGKTGKTHFYDLIEEIREMRKNLLKKIIKEYEGEVWCISKHLLAASMRLMEVGTKAQSGGNKEEAYDLFNQAYDLYALFWGIQMGVVAPRDMPNAVAENDLPTPTKEKTPTVIQAEDTPKKEIVSSENTEVSADGTRKRSGFMGKLGELVKKAVDCCIE